MSIFDKLTERVGDFFDEVMLPEPVRRAHDDAARHMNAEDFQQALASLRPTLIEHPNIARTHHLIGMCHYHREEWGSAIQAFERALAIKEVAASHYYAGLAAEHVSRPQDMQRHFSRALSLAEDLPFAFELHFGLGRAYRDLQRASKAVKELRSALKLEPGAYDATLTLAELLLDRGDVPEAKQALETVDGRDRQRALVVEGRIAEVRGEYAAALDAYERGADRDGEWNAEARLGAARNALRVGDRERANEVLEEFEPVADAHRCEANTLAGRIAEESGDIDRARQNYQSAIAIDPRRSEALLGLGRIELAADRYDEAVPHFVKVFADEDPANRQEAWWGAGRCHFAAGDLAGARHLFEQALELGGPRTGQVLWSLGKTALQLGDAAEAMVFLRDALEAVHDPDTKAGVQASLEEALGRIAPVWELPERMDGPERVTEVLEALLAYLGSDTRLSDFLPPAQKLHAAMNSPLSLAIVGEFNAGKSTIINALVGEDVFPTGVLPTTAHTGILRWGPRKAARVIYDDGTRVEQSLDEAKKTMKTDADIIERLEFTHPHPDLRLVHYWDTPGFNALEERHEHVAAAALERAEAILWVMDANQVLSQTEFERIDELPFGGERLVVVINKIDRLGPPGERDDEIEHLIEYVTDNLDDRIAGVFAISARDATSDDEAAREASGFHGFRDFLEHRVTQRAGRIKTIEVGRQLESLAVTLDAFQNGLIGKYSGLQEQVEQIERWLGQQASSVPEDRARDEEAIVSEWISRSLQEVEAEIADALRPTGSWTGRRAIAEEDREFVLGLMEERFDRILDISFGRTSRQLDDVERELAERVDPIVRSLSVGDARALQRRLDGFFDETRVLALLWEERIYGALRARARGRIETSGASALSTIEAAQGDPSVWRGALRNLLPAVDDEFTAQIRSWYADFFEVAGRFCARVRKDLELLELEANTRYDMQPMVDVIARTEAPEPEASDVSNETGADDDRTEEE